MADQDPSPGEPLDVQKIHYLVRLMKRYDLTDMNISDGNVQIRLRRRGPGADLASPYQPQWQAGPAQPMHAPHEAAPALSPGPEAASAAAPASLLIKSPMVGTYYASSSPDAPPFVKVGSAVQPDSTVCIIEAMKVFTDIPAGVSGSIAEILVKNGQAVEFDQPLFRVVPG